MIPNRIHSTPVLLYVLCVSYTCSSGSPVQLTLQIANSSVFFGAEVINSAQSFSLLCHFLSKVGIRKSDMLTENVNFENVGLASLQQLTVSKSQHTRELIRARNT